MSLKTHQDLFLEPRPSDTSSERGVKFGIRYAMNAEKKKAAQGGDSQGGAFDCVGAEDWTKKA